MKFFQNMRSLWRSTPFSRRVSPARGRRTLSPIEPLEVRALLAGEFADAGALGITGVVFSSVAWGDMDNDGDLDALVTGQEITNAPLAKVYQNNGDSTFTDVSAGLAGVYFSSVAWGDMDNDGDLDILLTGRDSSSAAISKVYQNNGNSTFTDLNTAMTGVSFGSAAWGDVNNDGDLDILLTGRDSTNGRIAKVYGNNGNGTFTDLNAGLAGVDRSSVAWGDTDNDGDLDILLTGRDSTSASVATVYRNNGNSTFTDLNAGLTGVANSSVAWGDMDNDGDLDILLSGRDSNNTEIATLYENNGNSTFTERNVGLAGVYLSSVAWGDMDNDGDLDILLNGLDSTNARLTRVYRNNGNTTFTDLNAGLTDVSFSSVAWGDMDNDGDLDILLTGLDSTNTPIAKVYTNTATTANTAPNAPTNLSLTASSSTSLTFQWTAPTDTQTPAAGLSYNLRVGTTPGGSDVFSSMASAVNGARRLPDAGPIQGTSYTLKNLTPDTTYYWSVQAVDPAFTGSLFAAEKSAVTNTAPTLGGAAANQAVNDTATITPFATFTVTDPDNNAMSASVTLLNGVVRGDFTTATTTGWSRTVIGNDIRYARTYSAGANIGATVEAAIRAFVFQPRSNAIKPNATEATAFTVTVTDGRSTPVSNSATTVITTSVNDAPTIAGTSTTVRVNDNTTVSPFPTLIVSDADNQEMLISVTILNGKFRGDLTTASTADWPVRYTIGNNITYKRYFAPGPNVGATAQAAFRALTFQPRPDAIKPGTTELTDFLITVSDGVAPAIADQNTRLTTTSINNAPTIGGASNTVTVNDNATVNPLATVTVADADFQEMLISVTILNGKFRGDFTNASSSGWPVRYTTGNDITYKRYFGPGTNVGAAAQAAFRALIFQARNDAITPGITEATDFLITVSDGVAPAIGDQNTRLTTTSVNDTPIIGGAVANQTMNDNETKAVFSTLTVTDPDTQSLFSRLTITNGVNRGDFTPASAAGWTRMVSGNDIKYERFFSAATNNGATVQAAIRALNFQPRNSVSIGTNETTAFTVFVNDGITNVTNSTTSVITSVITTGIAPRGAPVAPTFLAEDITTVVMPTVRKTAVESLRRVNEDVV